MAPERLGKYHILGMIAQGGMAEVYMAKTVGIAGFEKILAVKRIKPRFASEGRFIRNFIDEARIAVTLNHRNIVQVFDFGKADGELYLAMELLEGVDLRGALQALGPGQRIPASIAAYLLSEVASGLDYAHRKADRDGVPLGIVHCDVSPHNVLLSHEGFVKILDFGVARARFIAAPSSRRLRGKPRYMSPEQTRGDTPTSASDVFVVGILAWELFAGRKLFTGGELSEILKSVRQYRIPHIAGIRPDLPTPLCNAVMRALERAPEKRGTAREISSVLAQAGRELSEGSNAQALSTWLRDNCAPPPEAEQTQTDLAPAPAFLPSATTAVIDLGEPLSPEKTQTSLRLALTDSGESESDLEDHSGSIEQPPLSLASLIDKRRVVIALLRLDGGDESRRLQVSRALCDLAYKHGAVVHEHSDQEVVAIFGLELAGEDNIASSMHYALDAAELTRAADAQGQPMRLRSAARSGVVAQRRADAYQLRGDALNEARELARGAEPFRPLLSGGAGRVASAQFQFRELAARRYRSRRLRVLELTGPTGHDDRRRALRDRRGQFVGREEELEELWQRFQSVILHGSPSGVLVQGDSGIGKSRLIAEFVARLEETGTETLLIAVGATSQTSAAPLSMAVEHMQAALNLPPGRGENARALLAQSIASCLRNSASEEEIVEATQSFELAMELRDGALGINEIAAAALRERCAETIALVHRTLAGHRPSVVVLENVHLADEASIGVLRHILARKPKDFACVFVISARHELIGKHALEGATILRLDELAGAARATLIEDRLGEAFDEAGAVEVARRAGGNPLYIEELCRTIGEVGWDATPATIRDSVVARIDRLSRRTRAVLQRAAVIGESFRSSILEELVGLAVGPYLEELVEEGLLVQGRQADVQSQGGDFAFRHGLIQEVVYSSLSAAPRRATHANLGKLLVLRSKSGLDEPPAIVAAHLELGGEDIASATQWLRAGRVALSAFETASARDAYTTAIALLGSQETQDSAARALLREAYFGRARAFRDLGEPESQGADLTSLEPLCDSGSAEEAELVVHVAERLLRKGVFDQAIERAERAYEIAKEADVPLMQGESLRLIGEALERTGNFEAGQQRAEEALDIFEALGVRSFETRARISLARNFLIRARYADAKAMYEPIIEEVQRNRDPGLERIASNHLAVIHMCLGEFEDAMRCAQRSVSICEADGDQARAGDNLSVCGIILNEVGQYAVAKTYFERALGLHRETKSRWSEADSLIYAGTNAVMLGDIALGLKRLRLAYQYAGEIKSPYVLINAGIGLAEALLVQGKPGDAQKANDFAQKAANRAKTASLAGAHAMALCRQAQAQHRMGNLGEALELSTQAMEILDTQTNVEGSEEEIVYTHYQLLDASDSSKAESTLGRAIAGYERKLAALSDPSWRESFSDTVPTNRALVVLSEQTTK